MATQHKPGLLLINLGTTNSPRPGDVRRYLREFLSDPRVIDLSGWRRWLLLNLLILPFRPKQSGKAYAKIWSEQGSPLLHHSQRFADGIRQRAGQGVQVEVAMRYGQPSIRAALDRFAGAGVDRIVVFPLYPQYSSAATGSTLEKVALEATRDAVVPCLQTVPPFYDHPGFIESCAQLAAPVLERARPQRVFFSFHGLPERQILTADRSGEHCLRHRDCCERVGGPNAQCYRAQCFATARLLADRLGLAPEQRIVCFQSRLGRTPWIRPYTDELLVEEARAGCKRAVILSPAFVADCLETLEELGIRAVESFRQAGGDALEVVPCVNASEHWIDAAWSIVREHSTWIRSACAEVASSSSQSVAG